MNAAVSSRSVRLSLRLYFCWGKVCHRRAGVQAEPQATWRGLAKWLPTARIIRGSSVLFTLFNCLTVPVYAVPLPILPAFVKTAELAFNKSAAFESCQWPRCRMRPAPFRGRSLDPGAEARPVNTWGWICTEGTLMRAHTSARLPCTLVSSHPPPHPLQPGGFNPNISKWEASSSL